MPLEITYWTGHAPTNNNCAGRVISSEIRTLSGASAQSGATPTNAALVSIYATEAAHFDYGSSNPTASTADAYIGANERLWLEAIPGNKIAGITA